MGYGLCRTCVLDRVAEAGEDATPQLAIRSLAHRQPRYGPRCAPTNRTAQSTLKRGSSDVVRRRVAPTTDRQGSHVPQGRSGPAQGADGAVIHVHWPSGKSQLLTGKIVVNSLLEIAEQSIAPGLIPLAIPNNTVSMC